MPACFRHPSFLLSLHLLLLLLHARQECVSPHPGSNPLFEVPSPSFALLMSSFPSSILSVCLTVLSVGRAPPCLLQLHWGGGRRGPTDTFIVLPPCPVLGLVLLHPPLDHTCHLHRTQDGSREGFHPSLALHEPLIPSSPATLSLRNGRCRGPGRGGTQSARCQGVSFKQGQKGNHRR